MTFTIGIYLQADISDLLMDLQEGLKIPVVISAKTTPGGGLLHYGKNEYSFLN